jgi:hypothetical protein
MDSNYVSIFIQFYLDKKENSLLRTAKQTVEVKSDLISQLDYIYIILIYQLDYIYLINLIIESSFFKF